jgi:small subunit ribosomal protein S17
MKVNVPGVWGRRKSREGIVVSDKMDKTIVVAVQSNIRHKLYKKTIRRVKRYMAHDEAGQAKMGDFVRIAEAAPISKNKRWSLVQVIQTAELPELAPGAIDLELLGEVKREEPEAEAVEAAAVASPEAEAVEQPAVAAVEEAEPEAVAEMEPVQMDAPAEATEVEAETEDSVKPEEPEVPPIEEEEIVQADAGPEATEPEDKPEENLE